MQYQATLCRKILHSVQHRHGCEALVSTSLTQAVSQTENLRIDDGAIWYSSEAVVFAHRKTYKISQIRFIFTS